MGDVPDDTSEPSPLQEVNTLPQDPSMSQVNPVQETPGVQTDAPKITPSSPHPPGSAASVSAPASVADSIETVTPSLGGTPHTQVNVVSRESEARPSTADKPHQFYPNLAVKRHGNIDNDNDSLVSRSTANRTNFSMGGTRRPPSRSHIPSIMPAYSFYHPLRPPAVSNASGQEQIPEPKPPEEISNIQPDSISNAEEISSVHGKPSKEPLLPKPATVKQEARALHPVVEIASNRTSRNSAQLLGAAAPVLPAATSSAKANPHSKEKSRNWEHFPGKTKYHLSGRVQFGTQYLANIGTATLILIPTGLYFAFTYFLIDCFNKLVDGIYGQNIPLHYLLHSHISFFYVYHL
jgi:hypothetical protein